MKRLSVAAALALALALAPGLASAQFPYVQPQMSNPYARPTFSPYLNLMRGGTNPALNYYGLVRPQVQATRNMQVFQQELQTVASGLTSATEETSLQPSGLATTGHKTTFYNYGPYFPALTGNRTGGLGGFQGMPGRPQFGTLGGARPPSRR